MKTWITYLVATLMGLATCLLFQNFPMDMALFNSVSSFFINLMIFLYIPIIFISFSSGIGSLKKDNLGGKLARAVILWSLIITILCSLLALGAYYSFPSKFPVSSTAGSDISAFSQSIQKTNKLSLSELVPVNPFLTLTNASYFIVPIIIVSWILGLALKPSSDVIRPAYTVMNSFSEVMYRISRTSAVFSSVLVYIFSTLFFMKLWQDKTVIVDIRFLLIFICSSLILIFVALPFIFGLFTGFKKNPYLVFIRSLSVLLTGLTSSNILASSLIGTSVARQNLGVQKRITSTTIPLFIILSRGGTAFVSILSSLMILNALSVQISISTAFIIAGVGALLSFSSSLYVGNEAMVITALIFSVLKIDTLNAVMTMLGVLPFVNGIGIMLDLYIIELGSVFTSRRIGTDIRVPYRDII